MRTMSQTLFAAAAVTLVVSAFPSAARAQQQPAGATRYYVQVVRLKPDMVNDWMEVQKNEVIPAQKKAGVASRTTLATVVGNGFEYTMITPFPTWASFDAPPPLTRALGEAGAAAVNAKLRKCIMTQVSYMSTRLDDLGMPGGDAVAWRVAVRRALPGKMQDYLSYYKAEVMPALQKAKADGKIAGFGISRRGAGAPSGEFTTVTYYSKFADLDTGDPVVYALGQDAATKVNDKAALFSTSNQVVVRRRLADLSF